MRIFFTKSKQTTLSKLRLPPSPAFLLTLVGLGITPVRGDITYVDAVEGASGNTFAKGGSLADTSWIDTTSNEPGIDDSNWMKRFGGSPGWTEHNGGDVIQGMVSDFPNELGEIITEVAGLADGDYNVWVFFWEQTTSGTQNWVLDAGLVSGSLASYSASVGPVAGTDSTSAVAASTLTFSNSPSVLAAGGNQIMYGVNLGQMAVSGGSSINVYVDKLLGVGSNNRTIYDGVGYEPVSDSDVSPDPANRLFGIDFNRDDALGSPSQSKFRIVSGSSTQGENSTSYVKSVGANQITISKPNASAFEFRGANGDSSRAIPGGDTSMSFLVADFIATREGVIDISITNLAAGDYIFRSYHLEPFISGSFGFAQGASTTSPNTIEARIAGSLKESIQPTALGSTGLNTTFIADSQIPSLTFGFSHNGLGPLEIQLTTTESNGADSFLLLNGFELFTAGPQ